MRLSVIIPVYNEVDTIKTIISRIEGVPLEKEIIVVDDGSSDGASEILRGMTVEASPVQIRVIFHERNRGKGAAIQTGLQYVEGDIVTIQDADLEYHPEDYPTAVKLIENGYADAVYGSRFLGPHRCFLFWHYAANKLITFLCNVLFNTILTDMETGFQLIRADVMQSLGIRSRTFDFEVEVTAKLMKRKVRIYEIPITYTGRGYGEGKKIGWKDGFKAVWALLKFRVRD